MTDMLKTIAPKSDQLNFDDLIGGQTKIIKITHVRGVAGEQPIAINYEGDEGKPYMPCKSMRRVMVFCWGPNGHDYVGRYMTLYGDPKVKFGGLEVGGIRISHMSHITGQKVIALTASRANKRPFVVEPMEIPKTDPTMDGIKARARETAQKGTKELESWWKKLDPRYQTAISDIKQECWNAAKKADEAKKEQE